MRPGHGPTVEGLLARKPRSWHTHYRLIHARVLEAEDRSHTLDGDPFLVPRGNVYGVQYL